MNDRTSAKQAYFFSLCTYRAAEQADPKSTSFGIHKQFCYFLTFEETKTAMLEKNIEDIVCFQIKQIPFGIEIKECDYSTLWLFDKSGTRIDQSVVSTFSEDGTDGHHSRFIGRSKSAIRFGPGEIVEYISGDEIKLGVVLYLPPSVSDADTRFYDFSDDIYIIVDEEYECWGCDINVQSTDLLPLTRRLDKGLEQRLVDKYVWALNGN